MVKIAIMIPARNEEERLKSTLDSIKSMDNFSQHEVVIVVVDDGSKDNTAQIAEENGCHVVKRKDRGYSALATPELADTHNSGFDYIEAIFPDYDYIMIIGADTLFEPNYLDVMLNEFEKDPDLMIAAGILHGRKPKGFAVTGSGRLIRRVFWHELGKRLQRYYSWESYPVYYARAKGYHTKSVYDAVFYTTREPLAIANWANYGLQMKEIGYTLPFVFNRFFSQLKILKFKRAFLLLKGYFFGKCEKYPVEISNFVRSYQKERIKKFLLLK